MSTFPEIMRRFREEINGLTLRQLASMVDVSAGQLSQYERGLAQPKRDTVISIAEVLGIGVGDALTSAGYSAGNYPAYVMAQCSETMEARAAYETTNETKRSILPCLEEILKLADDEKLESQLSRITANLATHTYIAASAASAEKAKIAMRLLREATAELRSLGD